MPGILEFNIGHICVNDNNGGCTLGIIIPEYTGGKVEYHFEASDGGTVFTADDLRKITSCIDKLNNNQLDMVKV